MPLIYVSSRNKKTITNDQLIDAIPGDIKDSIILHRHVCLMYFGEASLISIKISDYYLYHDTR